MPMKQNENSIKTELKNTTRILFTISLGYVSCCYISCPGRRLWPRIILDSLCQLAFVTNTKMESLNSGFEFCIRILYSAIHLRITYIDMLWSRVWVEAGDRRYGSQILWLCLFQTMRHPGVVKISLELKKIN